MGDFPFISSTFGRVTNSLQQRTLLGSLRDANSGILQSQEQLATGRRVVRPSDDPSAAVQILDFENRLEETDQFLRNVQRGLNQLGATDDVLADIDELAVRARELGILGLNDATSRDQHAEMAVEVQQLLEEMVASANRLVGPRTILSGAETGSEPFVLLGDTVSYEGDDFEQFADISRSRRAQINVTGTQAFGALSTRVSGTDLDPDVSLADSVTPLADLNDGEGVRTGRIDVTFGGGPTTVEVDLSAARSLEDVEDLIEDATGGAVDVQVNAAGDGLTLDGGADPVTVADVADGSAAFDLGIRGTGTPLVGTDLDPVLRGGTPLALLRGGAGLDTSGIVITNGNNTATLDFTGMTSLEEVLDAINRSGTFVEARISDDGDSVDVVSRLQGARLTITENGGSTADQLGLLTTLAETPLEDLNDGRGVHGLPGDDFRITRADGTVFTVDISDAGTVQDVVDLINSDTDNTGGLLTASIGPGDNIVLSDTSGAGTVTVESLNGSFAASGLGIQGSATGPGPVTLNGSTLTPAGIETDSIFTALANLRDALQQSDIGLMQAAVRDLDEGFDRVNTTRADVGGRMRRLELADSRLQDEQLQNEGFLGDVRDVDFAEAVLRFQEQQRVFQAGLQAAGRILQISLLDFIG